MEKRRLVIPLIIALFVGLTILAVSGGIGLFSAVSSYDVNVTEITNELTIDNTNWSYDEENNIRDDSISFNLLRKKVSSNLKNFDGINNIEDSDNK